MFDLKTWEGFSNLPKEGLDFLLDTTAINKKMADRKENPYRWRVGSFHVPKGASKGMLERMAGEACKKFVEAFAKQGWKLESKLQVYKADQPFAIDAMTGAAVLDMEEWRVRGIFSTRPEPVRIELPPGIVRQDPEQKGSLKEAMTALGVSSPPRPKR